MMKNLSKVVIVVSCGVAEIVYKSIGVEVEMCDLDNDTQGNSEFYDSEDFINRET